MITFFTESANLQAVFRGCVIGYCVAVTVNQQVFPTMPLNTHAILITGIQHTKCNIFRIIHVYTDITSILHIQLSEYADADKEHQ